MPPIPCMHRLHVTRGERRRGLMHGCGQHTTETMHHTLRVAETNPRHYNCCIVCDHSFCSVPLPRVHVVLMNQWCLWICSSSCSACYYCFHVCIHIQDCPHRRVKWKGRSRWGDGGNVGHGRDRTREELCRCGARAIGC